MRLSEARTVPGQYKQRYIARNCVCRTRHVSPATSTADVLLQAACRRERSTGRGEAMLMRCTQRETDLGSYPPSALLLPQAPLLLAFLLPQGAGVWGSPAQTLSRWAPRGRAPRQAVCAQQALARPACGAAEHGPATGRRSRLHTEPAGAVAPHSWAPRDGPRQALLAVNE